MLQNSVAFFVWFKKFLQEYFESGFLTSNMADPTSNGTMTELTGLKDENELKPKWVQ